MVIQVGGESRRVRSGDSCLKLGILSTRQYRNNSWFMGWNSGLESGLESAFQCYALRFEVIGVVYI